MKKIIFPILPNDACKIRMHMAIIFEMLPFSFLKKI